MERVIRQICILGTLESLPQYARSARVVTKHTDNAPLEEHSPRVRPGSGELSTHRSSFHRWNTRLQYSASFTGLDLIYPPADSHIVWHQLCISQILHVILHRLLQLREREKVQSARFEFSRCIRSASRSDKLFGCHHENHRKSALPKVLLDQAIRILIIERQHAAASMLDKDYLLRPQELLRDDDAAQRNMCRGSSLQRRSVSISG